MNRLTPQNSYRIRRIHIKRIYEIIDENYSCLSLSEIKNLKAQIRYSIDFYMTDDEIPDDFFDVNYREAFKKIKPMLDKIKQNRKNASKKVKDSSKVEKPSKYGIQTKIKFE